MDRCARRHRPRPRDHHDAKVVDFPNRTGRPTRELTPSSPRSRSGERGRELARAGRPVPFKPLRRGRQISPRAGSLMAVLRAQELRSRTMFWSWAWASPTGMLRGVPGRSRVWREAMRRLSM
jgi:hypothetical protein